MANAHDVAAYILERRGPMSAMKLQKLVYYSYAWHLVWEEKRLFPERIQAWANGPVVRNLYAHHRGEFSVSSWPAGDASRLSPAQQTSIEAVLDFYGDKSAAWLSELTHREEPWLRARRGMSPGERGEVPITDASMAEYYGSL
ncbi:MAG: hypothetical protein JWQ32_3438 [Marmoricola sp.]|nr:hypothetical protein [Marmoricola sp.]